MRADRGHLLNKLQSEINWTQDRDQVLNNVTLRSLKMSNMIITIYCSEGWLKLIVNSRLVQKTFCDEHSLFLVFIVFKKQNLMHRKHKKFQRKTITVIETLSFIYMYICECMIPPQIVSCSLYCSVICFSHLAVYFSYKTLNLST